MNKKDLYKVVVILDKKDRFVEIVPQDFYYDMFEYLTDLNFESICGIGKTDIVKIHSRKSKIVKAMDSLEKCKGILKKKEYFCPPMEVDAKLSLTLGSKKKAYILMINNKFPINLKPNVWRKLSMYMYSWGEDEEDE